MTRTWPPRLLAVVALSVTLAFVGGPILLVLWAGLSDRTSVSVDTAAPTWRAVERLLSEPSWRAALQRSLVMALLVAGLALVTASLAALVSVRGGRVARLVSVALVIMPAAVPSVVYAVGLVLVAARLPVAPVHLLVVGHTVLATPLAFLAVRVGVRSLRPELVESARLLGATPLLILRTVTVPQLLPFAAIAGLLASAIPLAEPILPIFLLTDSTATLPQRSFQGLRFGFDPLIMTGGAIIVIVTLAVAAGCGLIWWLGRRGGR